MSRVFILATLLLLSACAQAPEVSPPATKPSDSKTVVNVTGLGDIKFGLTRTDLASHLDAERPGCHSQLREYPQGSAVFAGDGRLVLLWFDAPLTTVEGITTGTPLSAVKAAYPRATEVRAPEGSHRFDGLLVASGEHGYLFLHDGTTVQKAIAGYLDYLHRLFDSGFGVC
jgi:hypothetical protein